jgi:hypothetical protein
VAKLAQRDINVANVDVDRAKPRRIGRVTGDIAGTLARCRTIHNLLGHLCLLRETKHEGR